MSIWLISFIISLCSCTSLERRIIDHKAALCNDHSSAKFFIHLQPGSANWVIYLESGGGCSTQASCSDRYKNSQILMSSKWLDDPSYAVILGLDILSSNESVNPYHDYNHVYVPYCSSDMYTGMIDATDGSVEPWDPSEENFVFAGYHIIHNLFLELKESYKDTHGFAKIIFAGSSAGGVGVMNHIGLLKDIFSGDIFGIVDSSWFINFEDNFLALWDFASAQSLTKYQNFPSTGEICKYTYSGMPCCFQADCMNHQGAFKDTPMFFAISRNDIYLLQASMIRSLSATDGKFDSLMISRVADIAAGYSGAMILSINSTANSGHSYFVTSCLQHVYLAPSSLWEESGALHKLDVAGVATAYSVFAGESDNLPLHFNQSVTPGTYLKVAVGPPLSKATTLMDALTTWSADTSHSVYSQDNCVGIQCNPTCPEELEFIYSDATWSNTANIVIMAILGCLTLFCLCLKLQIMLYLAWIQRCQSRGNLTTETFIPVLGPQDMMSVACIELTHSVNFYDKEPTSGKENTKSYKKLHNDLEGGAPLANGTANPPILSSLNKNKRKLTVKKILDKVSVYFNPSSFVGIMGPSGCGKTTFLDIITGRRSLNEAQRSKRDGGSKNSVKILIDGEEFPGMQEEFTKSLAYVLQLERPYYDALTVRENLTFEALMRLPKNCPLKTVFSRVETVLHECGLVEIADTVVGGDAGGGISGGQKRRLCVALQLIDYPSIIFLDEPTSGLDSTSSHELISMLSRLQVSKRCIVITIHQPRQEIFHLFTHILLLVGGKVAYYGSPLKAESVLINALNSKNKKIEDFLGNVDIQNVADLIMDLLNNEEAQQFMIEYYQETETENVKRIIRLAKDLKPTYPVISSKKMISAGGFLRTILALESRIMIQQSISQILYLPLIFLFVPLVLGYVYFKSSQSLLIISVYCVVTCMGPLFMTSIIINLITDTLRVYLMQYKDGIGCLYHVVIMVFYRLVGLTTLPILLCSVIIYFMVNEVYDAMAFIQITLILIALCQAWIGVFSAVVYSGPTVALRVCPMVAAVSAFTSGFLVPEPSMPSPFWTLFFLNPTFWGMQAICKLLLQNKLFGCDTYDSKLSCQSSSGNFNLLAFGFIDGNPVNTGIVLFLFIILTQIYSVIILLYKYSPDPLHIAFCKYFNGIRCRMPQFLNRKVADDHLVIVVGKKAGEQMNPKHEWARVIGKVMKQQQEEDVEIDKNRVILSTFLEGIGHFVYKRGTNSERILEKHNNHYRNQNGVTEEMLSKIIQIMKTTTKPAPAPVITRRISHHERKRTSRQVSTAVSPLTSDGACTINRKAEIAAHDIVTQNRRQHFKTSSLFANAAKKVTAAQKFTQEYTVEIPGSPFHVRIHSPSHGYRPSITPQTSTDNQTGASLSGVDPLLSPGTTTSPSKKVLVPLKSWSESEELPVYVEDYDVTRERPTNLVFRASSLPSDQ